MSDITQGHKAEWLDRAWISFTMFNEIVADHPAAELLKEETEAVSKALWDYYQAVGKKVFEEM